MPMPELMTITQPNSASRQLPKTIITTNSTPRMPLKKVKVLLRTMSQVVRPPGRGVTFVWPASVRPADLLGGQAALGEAGVRLRRTPGRDGSAPRQAARRLRSS